MGGRGSARVLKGTMSEAKDVYDANNMYAGHLVMNSETEQVGYIRDYFNKRGVPISWEESGKIAEAIRTYSGTGYKSIREAFQKNLNNDARIMHDRLEAMISHLPTFKSILSSPNYKSTMPKGQYLQRGQTIQGKSANYLDMARTSLKTGQSFNLQGVSSWTDRKQTAESFNKGLVFHLVNAPSNKAASITFASIYGGAEHEVLYSAKANFIVTRMKQRKNDKATWDVYVKEV